MSQNPYAKKRGFKNDSKDRAAVVGNVVGVEVACDHVKLICASEERSKPRNANMWGTCRAGTVGQGRSTIDFGVAGVYQRLYPFASGSFYVVCELVNANLFLAEFSTGL
jgi:hypothetical protein